MLISLLAKSGLPLRPSSPLVICAAATLLSMAACSPQPPKGQVVANVDGQEITLQDLQAEARAAPAQNQTVQALLQRVVSRVLLAREAHKQKLDQYPGYPADIARLQQQAVVQKLLQATIKPPAKPTPANLSSFMAAHPFAFAQRQKLNVHEVRFQTQNNMNELQGATTLDAIVSRLKSLNAPMQEDKQSLDTAALPQGLSEKLLSAPAGELIFIRDGKSVLALVIEGRDPITLAPEQQAAFATTLMSQLSTEEQINAEITKLRNAAKITYQPGYPPPPVIRSPGPPSSAAQPATTDAGATTNATGSSAAPTNTAGK